MVSSNAHSPIVQKISLPLLGSAGVFFLFALFRIPISHTIKDCLFSSSLFPFHFLFLDISITPT